MTYTVTLNPALDYAVYLDQLETGKANRIAREELRCGGKGVNVSIMLHNLGVDTVALGFLAGFTGQAIREELSRMGVEHDFCLLPSGMNRINVKLSWGGDTGLNGHGPDVSLQDLDALLTKLDALTWSDTLVLAGSLPPSLPADTYERILARLAPKKLRVAVDVPAEALPALLLYHPFLVKPGLEDLARLCGRSLDGSDLDAVRECARMLQDKGGRNILVSMGRGGALLVTEDGQMLHQEAAHGEPVSSVGTGDALMAGFLAGYQRTGLFREALRMGAAAGSATAFSHGLATRVRVDQLLDAM